MDYIVIKGVPPYDGRWEFDLEGRELTTREWGWVKRLSGYLPLNVDEGLADPELIVVFACIALRRAQKVTPAEVPDVFGRLSDAPFSSAITMETDVEEKVEDDAGPPPRSSSSRPAASGGNSKPSSETSALHQKRSGMPGSATSGSVPTTSVK